jgi:hypothetical protein
MSSVKFMDMIKKDEILDIAPQLKRMKLNNISSNDNTEFYLRNYEISDPFENLKLAFPSISEKVNFFKLFYY